MKFNGRQVIATDLNPTIVDLSPECLKGSPIT